MSSGARPLILCVDDEVRVLDGLAVCLRKDYEVHTALSGEAGLQKLRELPNVSVVVSDMRMPGMDGATFLKRVMRMQSHVTRILLTGDPGRDSAVLAINEAQIFRFLTKPCAPDQLIAAIDAGVIQYRLANTERSVLQETLIGCIQALTEVLAIASPVVFGRASRVKRLAMQFAAEMGSSGFWQLEAASMLSQLGYLSLSPELTEKLWYGQQLTSEEQVLANAVPNVGSKLLDHIPRLEPVLQILDALKANDAALRALGDGTIGLGARILAIVLEYDALLAQGHSSDVAMKVIRSKAARFGEPLLDKFAGMVGAEISKTEVREMLLRHVQPGMTIINDLRTHTGTLLVPRGFEITRTFLERLQNCGASVLDESVKVLVPAAKLN